MDIFKIAGIGIVGMILTVMLKKYDPALAAVTALGVGLALFFGVLDILEEVLGGFSALIEKSGLDSEYIVMVTKIIGTAYTAQFAAQLCRDAGEGTVAMKIELAGKILILAMTMPILSGFLNICIEILNIL